MRSFPSSSLPRPVQSWALLVVSAFLLGCSPCIAADATPAVAPTVPKEKVLGIGGFFFKSKDPKGLATWYAEHLGITLTPEGYGGESWKQSAGPTAFQPFPSDTSLGAPDKQWMINFRVASLDAMVRQLKADGIKVKIDPTAYPNGRFAHLKDPEGNVVELWEPKTPPAQAKP